MTRNRYNKTDLEVLIFKENKSYSQIGKLYGVSGAAIKRAARKLGIILPKRQIINSKEVFSHKGFKKTSKVFSIEEKLFIEIIKTSSTWNNIGEKLGYKSPLSSNVKKAIKERCLTVGIDFNEDFYKNKTISLIPKQTKGDLFKNRKNWQSARTAIQKDARKIFFKNNSKPKCAICEYDKHVEVAHKRPVSDFPDTALISEINSIDNLVGLCPNHHWEYDQGLLKL